VEASADDGQIELAEPPRFAVGERVASRVLVRNDGTYRGKEIGDLLVSRGEPGYVCSIGTFLQQFYIYAVEFPATGHRVGMRARELCTLDHLPDDVLRRLGDRAGALAQLF
jgi:nitrogen fixation protein NifZ